jgi:hypothetical protein
MLDVKDRNGYDGLITSTVAITFHDESHRSGAADYWKFWIAQQKDIANPQAVEFGN